MIGICDLNNETVYSLVWRLRYRQCLRKCIWSNRDDLI